MKVLSIGECMVELSQVSPDDPTLLRSGFAGDTMNTAWYLARLQPDWDIQYLTHVGKDRLSNRMVSFLASSGIGSDFVIHRDDGTLGMYLIEIDQHGERSFVYWRSQSAARRLADEPTRLKSAMHQADVVYFSGITLAILPPASRINFIEAISALDRERVKVVFDPNLRPRLWNSSDTLRKSVTEAANLASIILPSFEDEATIFGDANPAATIARYRSAGAAEVVVKNGGDTIHAYASSGHFEHQPRSVSVTDSTAAGDSFNAGYLTARLSGADVLEALASGARVSERVVQSAGALVSLRST